MTPNVLTQRPPLWDAIVAAFPRAKGPGIIFSWGSNTLYCPSPMGPISSSLFAHERVHGLRQDEMGVKAWWRKYLGDERFRFDEELLAHRAEYQAYSLEGRSARRSALHQIAKRLASRLYGCLVTTERAKLLIAEAA